ncbi:helix-turn-helix domain-containing protein [Microbacterium sp. ABRD28]|uniref:helix-turn-helix domain-containing protein n=1 Tax=Microbacterium sp. ABRD28 TaxID=2268461 RepID=UPI000F552368|nr:helix-turn-helix domain-containing protein [Microbacterium sp. ABRD28]AZC15067.1 helix-turn-helix domain-containing protein [Microbacterium sp. ABRD28]
MSMPDDRPEWFGLASFRGAVPAMFAAHRHDDLEVNASPSPLVYLIDGRQATIPAGSLGVFWAARPHRLVTAVDEVSWVTVPLGVALGWSLPGGFIGSLLAGDLVLVSEQAGLALAPRAELWTDALARDPADPERRPAELEVEALLGRIAARRTEVAPGHPGVKGAAGAMAAFISERAADDIRVDDVARHVHLHPQYAMTLFRRALGITVGEYLLQCRVARAQRLLLTTDLPIAEVGFAAGFRSQSQFYARFRDRCGEPPAAYRRRLAGA